MNVYLNGQYSTLEDAKISVLDRGFLFADGIYEVIPSFDGEFFRFAPHIKRLEQSLSKVEIKNPNCDWLKIGKKLAELDGLQDKTFGLYIQATRGVMSSRSHNYSEDLTPTVVAFLQPFELPQKEELQKGFSAITSEDLRWSRCDIKSISLLPNIMAKQIAHKEIAIETIMLRDGVVTEGSASNVFIVKGGKVFTAPRTRLILGGITRDVIIELLVELGIEFEEKDFGIEELYSADEVWISSSTKNVTPIVKINNQKISEGITGPLWHKLHDAFVEKIKEKN